MKFSWIRKTCALLLAILLTACLCACSDDSSNDTSSVLTSSGNSKDSDEMQARLITPVYESLDTIVAIADVVADYGADPTGEKDSTKAIRNALTEAAFGGGGTVWMPKGTYRITNGLNISQGVTLRGEYNDSTAKDFNGDYGTVILAEVPSSDATNSGLIKLAASSGIEGITIAYPDQDINNVKPYPYTFYLGSGHRLRTIKNCTLINSYRGVFIGACEMPMIDNLNATCLVEGLCTMSLSDVGCFNNVYFTPDAWANCKLSGIKTATAAQIAKYSKDNKSNGMRIYDVEQQQFRNINVSGHYRGLFFPSKDIDTRFMGSGPMFGVFVKDCTYGIYAEEGTYKSNCNYAVEAHPILTGVDWRSGYNISYGSIEGSDAPMEDATATITLDGDGAGMTGIHVVYADNIMHIDTDGTYQFYPYAVRGKGKDVYCVDCCINGCTHGIDFRSCDGHTIETLVSACSHKSIVVSGNDGLVMSCLQNATLMYRTNILPTREHQTMQKNFFGPIGRPTTRYVVVEGGNHQKIVNCFIYGGNTFLTTRDAENVIVVNACTDSLSGNLYDCKNGQVAVMNSIRTAGDRCHNDGCRVRAYNEASLWAPSPDIIEN